MQKKLLSMLLVLLLCLSLCAGALAVAPERIVVLPVWATEILLEVAGPERIAGLSAYCDNPDVTYAAEAAGQVEGRVASNDPEGILMLAPDLIVIDSFSDYDGSLTKTLEDAGLTVVQMESPTDLSMVMAAITELGEITESQEAATALNESLQARLDAVTEKVSGLSEEERVRCLYYEDYYDQTGASAGMICAYGPGSTFDAIATAAGLINVCDSEVNYIGIDKEVLVADWKPELLVVPSNLYDENFLSYDDQGQTMIASILADPTLQTLPAVETQNVLPLDDRARSATSQYMVDAVEQLSRLAYPALYE